MSQSVKSLAAFTWVGDYEYKMSSGAAGFVTFHVQSTPYSTAQDPVETTFHRVGIAIELSSSLSGTPLGFVFQLCPVIFMQVIYGLGFSFLYYNPRTYAVE
jgi:hypothetical protein